MPLILVPIVFASTIMHATWNLLARRRRSEISFLYRILIWIALAAALPAFISEALAGSIHPVAWACLIGSGLCCSLYNFGLGRAYNSSDFTIVYPVARAIPVILVSIGDVLRGQPLTPFGWAGVTLVSAGCLLCPLHSFTEIRWRHYFNRTTPFVLLAALGTAGYSSLDKIASGHITPGPASAARYAAFFFLFTLAFYIPLARIFGRGEEHDGTAGWRLPALGAALTFGAYWLILWAYQLSAHAGYIVAFRQFSIVIGVVLAFIFYHERGKLVRITGSLLIILGILLIALLGN